MIAYWWCLCQYVCIHCKVRLCVHMCTSTTTVWMFLRMSLCVLMLQLSCVCLCVFVFPAIILGGEVCVCVCGGFFDDLWPVLWLPQGRYKTTEWSFIAFLLCLVLCFIHHSLFLFLATPLSFSFSSSTSLSPISLSLSLICSGSFLIKTVIDNLPAAHQWNHHYFSSLFVILVDLFPAFARRLPHNKPRQWDWCTVVWAWTRLVISYWLRRLRTAEDFDETAIHSLSLGKLPYKLGSILQIRKRKTLQQQRRPLHETKIILW